MRIGSEIEQAGSIRGVRNAQRRGEGFLAGRMRGQGIASEAYGGFSINGMLQAGASDKILQMAGKEEETNKSTGNIGNATAIYEAVMAGKENPIENMRKPAKVPYGHLAKDGVIEYNGVCFVCDEKTNSICLGDVTDPKKVLNIPLAAGGNLKVNRDSIGLLSKAIGMFSPEDVNRILRAIAQDTKIQSMKNEIEDMENSVGENLQQEEAGSGEDHDRDMDAVEDTGTGMADVLDAGFREKGKEV